MTVDVTLPRDDAMLSDIISLLRETRAAINSDSLSNCQFATGVQDGDAVYLDSDVNIWRQSLAGSATHSHFHGIADIGAGNVQIFGQVRNDGWIFNPGETVYVSDTDAGALTAVAPEVKVIAGVSIATEYLLLDSQISRSFTELQQQYTEAQGSFDSLLDRLDDLNSRLVTNIATAGANSNLVANHTPRIAANEQITAEVVEARGSRATIIDRLNESLNTDGTLKTTISASAFTEETRSIVKIADDTITVAEDRTLIYEEGRPIRLNSTLYTRVLSASYNAADNITTVQFDSSVLTGNLTKVEFGFSSAEIPVMDHATSNNVLRADGTDNDDVILAHLTNLMYKNIVDHMANVANPHSVTPGQIGALTEAAADLLYYTQATANATFHLKNTKIAEAAMADDSIELGGRTLAQVIADVQATLGTAAFTASTAYAAANAYYLFSDTAATLTALYANEYQIHTGTDLATFVATRNKVEWGLTDTSTFDELTFTNPTSIVFYITPNGEELSFAAAYSMYGEDFDASASEVRITVDINGSNKRVTIANAKAA